MELIEAAKLDGTNAWQMFSKITVPTIRPTLVVVYTTIPIATLKVFDITQTMTGAKFQTQVLANQMYDQSFTFGNAGLRFSRRRSSSSSSSSPSWCSTFARC